MPKYTVLIFTRPTEGDDAEFGEWYENTHLDDVLATAPGWTSGYRLDLVLQQGMKMPNTHLAIYEAEGESPEAVVTALHETRGDRDMSDTMDASDVAIWVFSEAGTVHHVSAGDPS